MLARGVSSSCWNLKRYAAGQCQQYKSSREVPENREGAGNAMAKKKVADLFVDTLAGADESNFR
jgi:hypothetical protein